ncbi:MAG: V-type ATP synthase subunit E [Desulfobacterota bacterium]|jgi:vacuolar-type H+-ATPase subunit E/Vma4|nr:V-type ATP synthase subunit E [Thermodesulfobacteriota bacterium]
MGLDTIRQVILDEAKAEAAHILQGARKAAQERTSAGKGRIDDESERLFRSRTQAIQDGFSRGLIQLKGNAGKEILARRGQIVRSVFAMAREELLSRPPDEYGRLMGRLLERAAGEFAGRVRIHPDDRQVFGTVLSEFNKDRGARGRIMVDEAEPLPVRGGFVFVTQDFEVDQTLETLLRELEQELLPIIAKELFS